MEEEEVNYCHHHHNLQRTKEDGARGQLGDCQAAAAGPSQFLRKWAFQARPRQARLYRWSWKSPVRDLQCWRKEEKRLQSCVAQREAKTTTMFYFIHVPDACRVYAPMLLEVIRRSKNPHHLPTLATNVMISYTAVCGLVCPNSSFLPHSTTPIATYALIPVP